MLFKEIKLSTGRVVCDGEERIESRKVSSS